MEQGVSSEVEDGDGVEVGLRSLAGAQCLCRNGRAVDDHFRVRERVL